MITISLLVWMILMFLNMPVSFAIIASSLIYYVGNPGLPSEIIFQRLVSGIESFPLLAIPLFILGGNIMNAAGISRRLMNFADVLVGHLVGGLAQVNVLLSTLMGGISGSSNADAAMEATILVPEMEKRGYGKPFSVALTAASSLITSIIPPGIGLIIYGFIANVSIGKMFVGGLIPGLLMCLALMLTVWVISRRRGYIPSREKRATARELWVATKEAIWALMIPGVLLLGLRFGLFTPTEAGSVVVMYALLISWLVYRELSFRSLLEALKESANQTAVVMLLIAAASVIGWFLTFEQVPNKIMAYVISITNNPQVVLLLITFVVLVLGMFMEGTANLILLTPLLVPLVTAMGIDPVHFGIVMVLGVTIGAITPPIGSCMFTVCSITKTRIAEYTREAIPFIAVLIGVLLLLTYVPEIVLFLPKLMD